MTNWASTTNYIIHFIDILFGLKSAWNRVYTGLAEQGFLPARDVYVQNIQITNSYDFTIYLIFPGNI